VQLAPPPPRGESPRREVLRALRHFLDRCEQLGILVKPGSIVHGSQVEYLGMRIARVGDRTEVSLLPSFLHVLHDRVTQGLQAPRIPLRAFFAVAGSFIHASRVLHLPLGRHLYQTLASTSRLTKGRAHRVTAHGWDNPVVVPEQVRREWRALLGAIVSQGIYVIVGTGGAVGYPTIRAMVDAGPERWGLIFGSDDVSFWGFWGEIPEDVVARGQVHREAFALLAGLRCLIHFYRRRYVQPFWALQIFSDCMPLLRAVAKEYSPSFALNASAQKILGVVQKAKWQVEWGWVPGPCNLADAPSRSQGLLPLTPVSLAARHDEILDAFYTAHVGQEEV
jgi:hypothetical protein